MFGQVTYQMMEDAPGNGLFVGGVTLPMALAELGLIDEYEFVVQPRVAGHGPALGAGLSKRLDLALVSRQRLWSSTLALLLDVGFPMRTPTFCADDF